jgi:hypothetical protein
LPGGAFDVRGEVEQHAQFFARRVQIAGEIGMSKALYRWQHGSHEFLFNPMHI